MTTGSRKTRNYTGKRPMLAFGQLILPLAALIASGLLIAGIRLFFLTPPERIGVEVVAAVNSHLEAQAEPQDIGGSEPINAVPDTGEKERSNVVQAPVPEKRTPVVMAGPVDPTTGAREPSRKLPETATAKKPAAKAPEPKKPGNTASTAPAGTKPAGTAKPAESIKPAESTKPAQPAATSSKPAGVASASWGVQIGAFTKESGANSLAEQAKKDGYSTSITAADNSSGTRFYRVRVLAGGTRDSAVTLARELEGKGYPVSVTPLQ